MGSGWPSGTKAPYRDPEGTGDSIKICVGTLQGPARAPGGTLQRTTEEINASRVYAVSLVRRHCGRTRKRHDEDRENKKAGGIKGARSSWLVEIDCTVALRNLEINPAR